MDCPYVTTSQPVNPTYGSNEVRVTTWRGIEELNTRPSSPNWDAKPSELSKLSSKVDDLYSRIHSFGIRVDLVDSRSKASEAAFEDLKASMFWSVRRLGDRVDLLQKQLNAATEKPKRKKKRKTKARRRR